MLAGLIAQSSGSATVAGCQLGDRSAELKLRRQIGVLPENVGLYEGTSAYDNLDYFGKLYGLDERTRRSNIERLLRMLGIWEQRDRRVATFSKGMKQKVAVARALVHDPTVLFLDEPTANLDPEATRIVRDFILELGKEDRTIFLNTHNLDEAQRVCDRVGILRTRLLTIGSPAELSTRLWGSRTVVRVERASTALVEAVTHALGRRRIEVRGDELIVEVQDPESENPEIAAAVVAAGGRLRQLSQLTPSLEDVYLKLVHEPGSAT